VAVGCGVAVAVGCAVAASVTFSQFLLTMSASSTLAVSSVPSPSVATKLHQPGPMGLAHGGATIRAGGFIGFLCIRAFVKWRT
jgi:hypothetical protein